MRIAALAALAAVCTVADALPDGVRVSVSLGTSHPGAGVGRGAAGSASAGGHAGVSVHPGGGGKGAGAGAGEGDASYGGGGRGVGTGKGDASYGHALFQDLFESLDRVISTISPVSRAPDGERSGAATPRAHLKSPRSVAEIRSSGGYPVVPATQSNAVEDFAAPSRSPDPPPCVVTPGRGPADGRDQAPAQTVDTSTSYVRGVTEHLLRMAAAQGGRARVSAPPVSKPSSSLASQMLQGTSNGLQEAKRLLFGDAELSDSEDTSESVVEATSEAASANVAVTHSKFPAPILGTPASTVELAVPAHGAEFETGGRSVGNKDLATPRKEKERERAVEKDTQEHLDAAFETPRKETERETDAQVHLSAGWMAESNSPATCMAESDSPTTYRAAQVSPWQDYGRSYARRALEEQAHCVALRKQAQVSSTHAEPAKEFLPDREVEERGSEGEGGHEDAEAVKARYLALREQAAQGSCAQPLTEDKVGQEQEQDGAACAAAPAVSSAPNPKHEESNQGNVVQLGGHVAAADGFGYAHAGGGGGGGDSHGESVVVSLNPVPAPQESQRRPSAQNLRPQARTHTHDGVKRIAGEGSSERLTTGSLTTQSCSALASSVSMGFGPVVWLTADSRGVRGLKALALAAVGFGCWKGLGGMMVPRNYSPVRSYFGHSLLDVPLTILDTILLDASDSI